MNFFSDKDVRFVAKDNLSRHIPLVSEMLRNQEHCMVPGKAKPMEAMAAGILSMVLPVLIKTLWPFRLAAWIAATVEADGTVVVKEFLKSLKWTQER